ncbi:MAG: hypothetical protein U1E33_01695 [Rhodospirillales bacterium]
MIVVRHINNATGPVRRPPSRRPPPRAGLPLARSLRLLIAAARLSVIQSPSPSPPTTSTIEGAVRRRALLAGERIGLQEDRAFRRLDLEPVEIARPTLNTCRTPWRCLAADGGGQPAVERTDDAHPRRIAW